MAGRYQGSHVLPDMDGGHRSVEVFWHTHGWFWRPRSSSSPADREAVGPFITSTEAYQNAMGEPRRKKRASN